MSATTDLALRFGTSPATSSCRCAPLSAAVLSAAARTCAAGSAMTVVCTDELVEEFESEFDVEHPVSMMAVITADDMVAAATR